MTFRSLLIAVVLIAPGCALAQSAPDTIASPLLRASVTVTSDVVRIGDVIDNAGSAAQIAIFRAPDLGTTGSGPVRQVMAALRAHQVIGVDTRDLRDISVTRAARTVETSDIERQIAQALERRNGLGDAANLLLTFDREVQSVQLDAANTGALSVTLARFEPRSGRFDVTLSITGETTSPIKMRFTGTAVETVEAVVLMRAVERNEVLKASDVVLERRPKSEIGADAAPRDRAIGMQARKQLRAGQALRGADLAKPDLVQRDQAVTLIYDTAGLYLTVRGKAIEGGTEGDVVNVLNLQSKRTVSGTVVGRGQVAVTVAAPRPIEMSERAPTSSVAYATAEPRKAE
ncbi:MAG: flagella basal body P-ring formation protein FlgA [Tardiphaga sp.]|nr:flagella basal body P-ring formation protein FlgA [Tardiphaga sp.]